MKNNITISGVVMDYSINELISFKLEITPAISAAELMRMKTQSRFEKAIGIFKKWKNEFFTLEGFDNYNFYY